MQMHVRMFLRRSLIKLLAVDMSKNSEDKGDPCGGFSFDFHFGLDSLVVEQETENVLCQSHSLFQENPRENEMK
jgi:hypothetical protein